MKRDNYINSKDSAKSRIKLRIKKRRRQIEVERSNLQYNPRKHLIQTIPGISGRYIQAPNKISFYEVESDNKNYDDTLRFIDELSNHFCNESVVVDFRNTTRATAAALVVIYATLEQCLERGYKKSKILYPEDSNETRRLLKAKNIHKLILGTNHDIQIKDLDTLPIISSTENTHFDDIIDHIQKKIFKNEISDETEYFYSDAVSETINNVNRHAYPDKPKNQRKWWLTCSVIQNQLYLAIYDAGVGIPTTVIQKEWFFTSLATAFPKEHKELLAKTSTANTAVKRILSHLPINLVVKDHQLIYLAFMGDVSGTKLDKHGQGSKSIRTLVKETRDGKLWAFSGKGLYTLKSPSKNLNHSSETEDLEDLEHSIHILPSEFPGTLIQWNIKLS